MISNEKLIIHGVGEVVDRWWLNLIVDSTYYVGNGHIGKYINTFTDEDGVVKLQFWPCCNWGKDIKNTEEDALRNKNIEVGAVLIPAIKLNAPLKLIEQKATITKNFSKFFGEIFLNFV